jgi:hypothetical protein
MVPYMSYVYDTMMITRVRGCTLSAEKNFQRNSAEFLFDSSGLFTVLYGVSGLFSRVLGALLCCLWCDSAWFVVRIAYVDVSLREREFYMEKATNALHLLQLR